MAEKIAISVDAELLGEVESLRRRTKESRSAIFARAARMLLEAEEQRRKVERYAQAYREQPETEIEIAPIAGIACASLPSLEWESSTMR